MPLESQRWVEQALLGEAIAISVATCLLFGHAWLRWWRRRRDEPRLDVARAALVRFLDAPLGPRGVLRPLRRLPARVLIELLRQVGPSLDRDGRRQLIPLAAGRGLVVYAVRRCRSRLWWRRLQGIRLLGLLGGDAHLSGPLLRDPVPQVRAEAAQWAAESPNPAPALVEELFVLLADPAAICRFMAKDSLLRMGAAVVRPLADHMAERDVALEAALEVAIGLAGPTLLRPALPLCGHGVPRVRALAAELLAAIGGADAAEALQAALTDPDASVRAAAAGGLGRLGHLPAVAKVAELLRYSAWDVRRAAAVALRSLGPAGLLLLRRSLADADPFAADMARQILDLPDASA